MAEVNRIEKYAEWLVQNKDKQGTPEFATVAEAYKTMRSEASAPTAPTQAKAPDTSILGAFGQGVDQSGAMVGKGIQSAGEFAGVDAIEAYGAEMAARNEAQLAASNYQRPEGADGIIKNLKEGEFANAGNSLLYGAAEAAPQVAGGVVASVGAGLAATSAPILGTAAAIGGTVYGTINALGQVRDEKEQQELDPTATGADLATAVASGLVELLPIKGGGATLKVLREAGQEGVQESLIIGNSMVQGGEYVPQEVFERVGDAAITGGAIAKGVNIGISTVNKAGEVVFRPKEDLDPETSQAAGDVARLMEQLAKDNGYKLKDIDPNSKKGAKEALEQAREKLNVEIDEAGKTLRKEIIGGLDQEVQSRFNAVINSARTKVARTVNKGDIQFLKDTVGSSKQGQMLVQSMYKTNVLTELSAAGLKGGVSQFTDAFNPLPKIGSAYNPTGVIAGNINTGAAFATGGSSLAAQIPLVVGGRAIDAVTGRRSKVNRFVQKNKRKDGLGEVTGPSIEGISAAKKEALAAQRRAEGALRNAKTAEEREAASKVKQEAEQKEAFFKSLEARRNVQQYMNGERPKADSPRGIIHQVIKETYGTQDRTVAEIDAEVMRSLDELLANPNTSQERKMAINDYKKILSDGTSIMEGSPLNDITSLLASKMSSFESKPKKKTKGDPPEGPPPLSPQAARGKAENEALLATLRGKMESDTTISDADRSILSTAFDDLKMNLGKNPLEGAEGIMGTAVAKLSNPSLAETHLSPYISRVRQQQEGKNAPSQPEPSEPTGNPEPSGPSPVDPVPAPPTGPVLQPAPEPAPAKPKPVPEPPTPKQVVKEKPQATAIIEIGKKGSKYENGIKDWDMALEAAKLLGQTVRIASSGTSMRKLAKQNGVKIGTGTRGVFSLKPGFGKGAAGQIFAIKPGGSFKGKKRTTIGALTTLIHEIAHGVTLGPLDGESTQIGSDGSATNKLTKQYGAKYPTGSFVGSAIVPILSEKGIDGSHPIVAEVNNLQWNIEVYLKANPSETRAVRDFAKMTKDIEKQVIEYKSFMTAKAVRDSGNRQIEDHQKYTLNFAEFAVDPVWVYMFDPALAKQVMPETTALIRKEFAKAGNKQIQFYGHPFATILAVVSAMAALGLGDDSEEELPDGALSPMPGALSA
jgi:hypothetical protein